MDFDSEFYISKEESVINKSSRRRRKRHSAMKPQCFNGGGRHLAGEGEGKKIQKEREGERTIILRML